MSKLTRIHVRGAAISGHLPINGWGSCSGCPRTPGCRSLLSFSVRWGSLHTGGGPGLKIALKIASAKRIVLTHRLSGCWLPSSSCVSGTWATHGHQRGRGGRAPCTVLCYKMIIKLRDAYGGNTSLKHVLLSPLTFSSSCTRHRESWCNNICQRRPAGAWKGVTQDR